MLPFFAHSEQREKRQILKTPDMQRCTYGMHAFQLRYRNASWQALRTHIRHCLHQIITSCCYYAQSYSKKRIEIDANVKRTSIYGSCHALNWGAIEMHEAPLERSFNYLHVHTLEVEFHVHLSAHAGKKRMNGLDMKGNVKSQIFLQQTMRTNLKTFAIQ